MLNNVLPRNSSTVVDSIHLLVVEKPGSWLSTISLMRSKRIASALVSSADVPEAVSVTEASPSLGKPKLPKKCQLPESLFWATVNVVVVPLWFTVWSRANNEPSRHLPVNLRYTRNTPSLDRAGPEVVAAPGSVLNSERPGNSSTDSDSCH